MLKSHFWLTPSSFSCPFLSFSFVDFLLCSQTLLHSQRALVISTSSTMLWEPIKASQICETRWAKDRRYCCWLTDITKSGKEKITSGRWTIKLVVIAGQRQKSNHFDILVSGCRIITRKPLSVLQRNPIRTEIRGQTGAAIFTDISLDGLDDSCCYFLLQTERVDWPLLEKSFPHIRPPYFPCFELAHCCVVLTPSLPKYLKKNLTWDERKLCYRFLAWLGSDVYDSIAKKWLHVKKVKLLLVFVLNVSPMSDPSIAVRADDDIDLNKQKRKRKA